MLPNLAFLPPHCPAPHQVAQGRCWRCGGSLTCTRWSVTCRHSCLAGSPAWPCCCCTPTRQYCVTGWRLWATRRGTGQRGPALTACSFLPSRWPPHEQAIGSLARKLGFTQVSLSSEVMPMVRAVPRGYTVCADAYLTPKIRQYLKGFVSGFRGGMKVSGGGLCVPFMCLYMLNVQISSCTHLCA